MTTTTTRDVTRIERELLSAVKAGDEEKARKLSKELRETAGEEYEFTITFKTTLTMDAMGLTGDGEYRTGYEADNVEPPGTDPSSKDIYDWLSEVADMQYGDLWGLLWEWGFCDSQINGANFEMKVKKTSTGGTYKASLPRGRE